MNNLLILAHEGHTHDAADHVHSGSLVIPIILIAATVTALFIGALVLLLRRSSSKHATKDEQ